MATPGQRKKAVIVGGSVAGVLLILAIVGLVAIVFREKRHKGNDDKEIVD